MEHPIAAAVYDTQFYVAVAIFVIAYAVIVTDKIHKTIIALVGASLMLGLKILTQEEAFYSKNFGIDYNVIFLLISMMIIINIMKETGVFQWLAIKSAKIAKGDPFIILIIFNIITAVVSAFLDNVTTVLFLVPITIAITRELKVDPIPYMITLTIASNIGGTATLIGDPPNIMIASKANLDFMAFVYHLTPVIIIVLIVYLITLKFIFGKSLGTTEELKQNVMKMDETKAIKDAKLLKKCLVILAFTVTGFVFHGALHFEPATIALCGASALFLISHKNPVTVLNPGGILREVEWTTLFFFIGLFIIIGGVVKVGFITMLSKKLLELTQGNLLGTSMAVLWFSAFLSAIIDNIPYVATMNPLIVDMAKNLWPHLSGNELLHYRDLMPIWWSLALGACLGGNGTAIGASANVIVCGLSEKAGHFISFKRFFLYGMPLMIESVIICTFYIWIRYYVLGWI